MSARTRIVGAFVRAALWASRIAGPRVERVGPAPTTLRIETDVQTALDGPALAAVLRGLAAGEHAATLRSLADGIDADSRPAPDGTRGAVVSRGSAMKMDADAVGRMAVSLYETTRRMTREPGELVEINLSVVVTSLATTRDAMPVTALSIDMPRRERAR